MLSVFTWDGPVVRADESDAPTVADVHAAIARLDGVACTEVSLARVEPFTYFTAAGGPKLYLVTGETADEEILQLTDPDSSGVTIPLICGGQLAAFARHDLVDRDAATRVFVRFLEDGDHDASLPWSVQ
jgi:hypothetical protein